MRSFERSHITKQCACSTPGAIIFSPFLRLRVDRGKRLKHATCRREFFQKRRKNPPYVFKNIWIRVDKALKDDQFSLLLLFTFLNFKHSDWSKAKMSTNALISSERNLPLFVPPFKDSPTVQHESELTEHERSQAGTPDPAVFPFYLFIF